MPIPFSTTVIAITRTESGVDVTDDPYDSPSQLPFQVAEGVRAVIALPSGSPQLVGGNRIVYNTTMTCDSTDLQPNDIVTDNAGNQWRVMWARHFGTFGLDHVQASLRQIVGAT